MSKLFCFGLGYSASVFAKNAKWQEVNGTHRDDFQLNDEMKKKLAEATHILLSIPPDADGDLVIRENYQMNPQWVGYLSTTGVYGNHDGGWVDEATPTNPNQERSKWRAIAEKQWLDSGYPVQVFRLSGIYGAGRSAFEALENGTARRIDKENQFFSRIHVEDIAKILESAVQNGKTSEIYNCADDFPSSQQEVVAYAAELAGVEPPPLVAFADSGLSDMARSFYSSSRKVKNDKIKMELGIELAFPTYKEGLKKIWEDKCV